MKKIIGFVQVLMLVAVILSLVTVAGFENVENTLYSFRDITQQTRIILNREHEVGDMQSLIDKVSEAVVYVAIYEDVQVQSHRSRRFGDVFTLKREVGSGSGFFITSDGYLLTNKHVVSKPNAEYTVRISQDVELPANVVYKDPNHDLAVLKVAGSDFSTIPLADSADLEIGDTVIAIGNAMGEYMDTVSSGQVSRLNRDIYVTDSEGMPQKLNDVIQTSAKLYPGDSGGPLIDSKGRVVGVDVASQIGADISFSIPVAAAKDTIRQAGINI